MLLGLCQVLQAFQCHGRRAEGFNGIVPPVAVVQRLLGGAKEIAILVDDDEHRVRHQRGRGHGVLLVGRVGGRVWEFTG